MHKQAAVLGVEPPSDEAVTSLFTPARHERRLELPGTGGWLTYALCTRPEAELYLWENFTVRAIRALLEAMEREKTPTACARSGQTWLIKRDRAN